MRAEASSARQEAGKPAQEAEGRDPSWRGGGELAPHQLASCETGRITGKELGQTEMSGPQEQADSGGGDVGHGCWGPGDAGWSLGPPVPKTRHRPAASLGRGEAAGDAGAPGSPHPPRRRRREPGPALAMVLPSPPDGWAGGQWVPPLLPNQTLEKPERPLLFSQRKPRVRGRLPSLGSCLGQLAKLEAA